MNLVYICSPLAGDITNNIHRACQYARSALDCGLIPIAPHVYLTQFMNDEIPSERKLCLQIGLDLLSICTQVWVFGDRISQGMQGAIEYAKKLNLPIRYFRDERLIEIV